VEQGPERLDIPLTLEAVDYNDDGDIVFSGRADPGHMVRIYVDDLFVGETTADADGRWVFAGHKQIAPGRHTLRAELMDPTGNAVRAHPVALRAGRRSRGGSPRRVAPRSRRAAGAGGCSA
jgi:hypothetical protein